MAHVCVCVCVCVCVSARASVYAFPQTILYLWFLYPLPGHIPIPIAVIPRHTGPNTQHLMHNAMPDSFSNQRMSITIISEWL